MYGEIAAALAHGESGALLTVVKVSGAAPCGPGTKLFVRADGSLLGTLGGKTTDTRAREDALRALATGQAELLTYSLDPEGGEAVGSCGATLQVFVEPVKPEPRLLIAGSGYVAQALARMAVPLGWRVTLVDDRSEFVRAAALPEAVTLSVGEIPELVPALLPDPMTAIVVVTRGHRVDREALQAALSTRAGYIGMIGSIGKVRTIFRALLREGVAPEMLERVHAPIGLDIGAETPDEIALSIAAELVAWRRGGTGEPLRERAHILALLQGERATETSVTAREPEGSPA